MSSQELKTTEVHYPESDGKPMAETGIHRQLRGFRLKDGILQPIRELRREENFQVFLSEVLGLELHGGGMMLRWVDPATGEPLPSRRDLSDAARRARRDAENEKARADAAEAELARLRSEIEKRRGNPER